MHFSTWALGTDCKSLYDVCNKSGSLPNERRVALDLLDIRESIEQYGDIIRWIPTDHMLVDCLTKNMHTDMMSQYLTDMVYSLKYDEEIKDTKRAFAKARKLLKEKKKMNPLGGTNRDYKEINFIERIIAHLKGKCLPSHLPEHYIPTQEHDVELMGYREGYQVHATKYCA